MDMKIEAARKAIHVNPDNDPLTGFTKPAGATLSPLKMALITGKRWHLTGQVLRVRFLDGSPKQRTKTQEKAGEWEQYANVRFDWSGSRDAEVRISYAVFCLKKKTV